MMGLSVIIPSKTLSNVIPCASAVHQCEPEVRILVVDDGIEWAPSNNVNTLDAWIDGFRVNLIHGKKPFIFSRNVNLAIAESGDDDVVILNDDAILRTAGGFSVLAKAVAEHPEYGLIASTTNNVGNTNQFPKGIGLREEPRMVCFVCVYVPRGTINEVGLLDERFVGYGMDDDDYSLRVRKAGLKIGIHDGCFVDHVALWSSFRGAAGAGGNFLPNMKLFIEKWGVDNWGKDKAHSDFSQLFA